MTLDTGPKQRTSPWELAVAPPPEKWDDWVELEASAWPERVEKHYALIPTICLSACGLVAYVDKESGSITKFEGNPVHPGSRGRTCAKGPATINQIHDTERILKPLKRKGKRGAGEFVEIAERKLERATEALDKLCVRFGASTVVPGSVLSRASLLGREGEKRDG